MKRIISLFLALTLLVLSASALTACKPDDNPPDGTVTRMTVDINPSIELMVDDQNHVVSATAQNDDGAILIAGEELVGLTAEDAAKKIVSIAIDTGYITAGVSVSADDNTVKISVSGDSKYAENLKANVKADISALLEKSGIPAKVEEVSAMTLAELRKLAVDTGLCTKEEAEKMDEIALCKILAADRIDTALLLTEELRTAYHSAKDYKISLVEREETAKIIEGLGSAYSVALISYKAALAEYSALIQSIDDLRYSLLVSPDSAYQKKLAELRANKAEYLKERTYVASLEINDTKYAEAKITLKADEDAYNNALKALEALGDTINKQIDNLLTSLRAIESRLVKLEEAFPETITDALTAKATETEQKINAAKDNFFTEFEKEHGDDINAVRDALIARKQALIDSAKGNDSKS